jgi:hypothetical protein
VLIVGVNLVIFVSVAPGGILGLAAEFREGKPGRRAAIAAMILGVLSGDAGIAITGAAGTGWLQFVGIAIPLIAIGGGALTLVNPKLGVVLGVVAAVASAAVFGVSPTRFLIPVALSLVSALLAFLAWRSQAAVSTAAPARGAA